MNIVFGSELAKRLKDNLKEEVNSFKEKPRLAIILIGDNEASLSYIKSKEKACSYVDIDSVLYHYNDIEQDNLIKLIKELNSDNNIHGILLQLPLPKHLDERMIINTIDPNKDVDGLTDINMGKLFTGQESFVPCTPLGIIQILKEMKVELEGKNVCVIGRSNLVGLPLSRLLTKYNATVTLCHSKTKNLKDISSKADIVIVAIGNPKYIDNTYIKNGAYVIDVGINRVDNHLCGDVDFDSVKDKVAAITPVPKGVGPMTVCMLMYNVIKAFKIRRNLC